MSGSALFAAESRIIQAVAARENAVIVGRGGVHVLRGHLGLVSVFIHASETFRVTRVSQALGITELEAAERVRQSDRQRAGFNRAIAGRDWTDGTLYDLCIDTSTLGIEQAADIVAAIVAGRRAAPTRDKS